MSELSERRKARRARRAAISGIHDAEIICALKTLIRFVREDKQSMPDKVIRIMDCIRSMEPGCLDAIQEAADLVTCYMEIAAKWQ